MNEVTYKVTMPQSIADDADELMGILASCATDMDGQPIREQLYVPSLYMPDFVDRLERIITWILDTPSEAQ